MNLIPRRTAPQPDVKTPRQGPAKTARETVPAAGPEQPPANAAASRWYHIRIATAGPIGRIQEWLDDNCQGRWQLGLAELDENLVKKVIEVVFDSPDDREAFAIAFAKRDRQNP